MKPYQAFLACLLALNVFSVISAIIPVLVREPPQFAAGQQVLAGGVPAMVTAVLPDGTYRVLTHLSVRVANPIKLGPKFINVNVEQIYTFYEFELVEVMPPSPTDPTPPNDPSFVPLPVFEP